MDHQRDQAREEEAARAPVSAGRAPGVPPHEPPAEGRDEVDVGSEESMPASDPPAGGGPSTGG
jgi:hypothetical protein